MSDMVDDRVVEMRFDNSHFEKNVQTSMRTLDKLNESLDLTGASKGLENVSAAAKGLDLSPLSAAAEGVRVKFSALQVMAVTALSNITNSALNAGKKIASALTIDPIKSGFQDYETQINAVQTILANTSSKGKTLKDVNAALDELNKYADKTIYNFTEMTRNIGTFTAAGVDLDTSVSAIKGIANLAAVSGSTSQQASTAMYQLSQALASGTVKLQDWNSVVNAGMGGQVFQDAIKDTARVHGIAIDDMIKSEGSFRETLKNGWLTSEILTETLSKFTGDLNKEQLKTMGYTDEQIESIIKMGQTANDAATKVKTFTQLFDTLKEAAQSGWTQSWEIIVGDFEEAKELLTEVSDIFGGFINASAEARNEMLQGWKDLGGRTVLIDALRNAFEGVMSIISPIKEAFQEIFPPTTAKQLYALTEGFKKLMSHLKLSEKQSANLKATFKGLFAVIDIVRQAFVAVWNAIKPLFGGVGSLGDAILGITGSWGNWLVKLNDTIKKTDIFNKVLQNFVGVIQTGVAKVKAFLTPVIEKVKEFVTSVKEKLQTKGFELFHDLLGRVNARMEETGEAVGNMKTGVTTAVKSMGEALANSKFVKVMFTIWEAVKMIVGGITKAIGDLVKGAFDKLGDANFDTIFDLVSSLSVGGISVAITKFINSLSEVKSTGMSFISGLTDIKDAIVGTFGAIQSQLKAGTLMKIATAIAILAASVLVISLIDSDKLAASLASIGALFAELLTSMSVFGKFGDFDKSTTKACTVMIAMSVAIAILAGAMVKIGSLEWDGVKKGIAGVAALSAVVVGSSKLMSKGSGQLVKGASSLVIFALAIKVLASACEDLGQMDAKSLVKGLSAVGILLAEVAMFMQLSKFSSVSMSTALGIVAISGAIKILASACSDFAAMSVKELVKGLGSVFVVLLELSLFTNLNSGSKNMISIGLAMIAIGAAMKILASAMSDIRAMSGEQIGKSLLAMLGALTVVTAFAWAVPNDLTKTAVSLVIIGAALNILASALRSMGGMKPEEMVVGLTAMGIALAEVAIALNFMTGTLAGSAALLVAAAALAVLAPVLALLGAMSIEGICKSLIMLAGTFAVIGAAGYILAPIVPAILGLAAAFALVGAAVLAIGAGLILAGAGLSALAVGFTALAVAVGGGTTAIVAGLTAILVGIIGLIPSMVAAFGEGIIALCVVIAEGAPAICEAITKVLQAVIKALMECIPPLIELLGVIVTEVLAFLVAQVPAVVNAALQMIVGVLLAIAENLDDVIAAGFQVIASFLIGIGKGIPILIDGAFKMIIEFINGLAKAIRDNTPALIAAVDNLMSTMVWAIGQWVSHFVDKGKNLISGLIDGVKSMFSKAWEAIKGFFSDIVDGVKDFLGIHSPSTVFADFGKNLIDGLIEGIKSMASKAWNSVKNFFGDMVGGVKDFLGIHSPSRVFADIGKNTMLGFNKGVGNMFSSVGNKAKEVVTNAVTAVRKFPEKFKSAGKELMSNVGSGIKSKMSDVKSKASSTISAARTAVSNWTSKFKSSGGSLISNVVSGFGSKLGDVKSKANSVASTARTAVSNWTSKFKSTAQSLGSNVASGLGSKLGDVKSKASNLASSAKNAMSNWYNSFKSVGKNLISGFISGIGSNANSLVRKAEGVVGNAISAAKNLLGIHSPSKVFEEIGRFVDEGFINGLTSFAGRVVKATENVGGKAIDAMSSTLSGISGIVADGLNTDPVIRPVLDLSQVRDGSGLLNGLFSQQTVALAGVNAGIIGGNIDTLSSIAAQMENANRNGNSEVVGAIADLRQDVADLADAVTKMKLVMDSGTVVGELLPRIDNGLGRMAGHKGRGN